MNILITKDMTVDSVTIAQECEVEHESAIRLLNTHLGSIEGSFGGVRFEIGPFDTAGGPQHRRIANLTEEQAMALITLFRNTAKVVQFKLALVGAFVEARRQLREGSNPRLAGFLDIFAQVRNLGVSNDMAADVARSLSWNGGQGKYKSSTGHVQPRNGRRPSPRSECFDDVVFMLEKEGPLMRPDVVSRLTSSGLSQKSAYRALSDMIRNGSIILTGESELRLPIRQTPTNEFAVTP